MQNDSPAKIIIFNMRLPAAVMAVVAGASLGLSGAIMQTILQNPLASPYTLGIGSASAFGAAFGIVFFGGGFFGVSFLLFCFLLLVYFLYIIFQNTYF